MTDQHDPSSLLTRRAALRSAAAGAALGALTAFATRVARAEEATAPASSRAGTIFVGHGSPMLALDARRGAAFTTWGERLGRPVAILSVSAHFERAPATVGTTTTRPLVYDFRGFPRALHEVRYAAPGAPKLARRVEAVLAPLGGVRRLEGRGHDHGTWVPLRWLRPQADVPVLSLSLPTHDPRRLWQLGRALRPLRDEGVLVMGSGNLTHNLRRIDRRPNAPVPAWAGDFDAWATRVVAERDVDALLDWERKAPAARTNHPTVEHFVPLVLAAAASHDDENPSFPITGWDGGSLSRRSVSWGA